MSNHSNDHSISSMVSGKLEAFLSATRQLEDALNQEKRKNQKLSEEFAHTHSTYDRMIQDLKVKIRDHEINENKLKNSVAEHKNHQDRMEHKLKEIAEHDRRTKAELQQYKAAWADVLTREREAKSILQEHNSIKGRFSELEHQNKNLKQELQSTVSKLEQAERHSESYQRELQNALVRIHSAEAKFNELSKEVQTLNQIKQNAEQQISKLESSMRERFKWELATERERIKAELEKEAALEREKFRELCRKSVEADRQKVFNEERENLRIAQGQLEFELAEVQRQKSEYETSFDELQQEIEALKKENDDTKNANLLLKEQLALSQREIVMTRDGLEAELERQKAEFMLKERELTLVHERAREGLKDAQSQVQSQSFLELQTIKAALEIETERANSLEATLLSEKVRFENQLQAIRVEVATQGLLDNVDHASDTNTILGEPVEGLEQDDFGESPSVLTN